MEILTKNLGYTYPDGTEALRGIDIVVESGSSVLILGHNGAGKSTFVRHLNGIMRPTAGEVLIGGIKTSEFSVFDLVHRVALSFQNPDDQIFSKTVLEEVSFGPKNLGTSNYLGLARHALQLLHLDGLEFSHPYDLHPTKRKMLTIASAIAMDTPILVFDEPTAGFDLRQKRIFSDALRELKQRGKTVLVVSHDIDYFIELCDSLVVLHRGLVEFSGRSHDLARRDDLRHLLRRSGLPFPTIWRMSRAIGLKNLPSSIEEFTQLIAEEKVKQQ